MYLTPTAVTLFAPAIALFSIAIYLFIGVKNKSAMEWWLCISTFGFALFDVDLMLWSMFRNYHELGQWLPLMMMFSALLTVYPAIQFVWAFPKSDQPPTGHYKWMMRLYGVLVVIAVTVIAIEQVWGFFVLYFTHQYVYGVVALYAVYTIVLLLEKWWLYRRMYLESAERQEQKDVLEMHQKNLLAARQLLGVSFPLIVLAIISGVFASFAGIGLNDYIIPMVGVSFAVMSAFAVIAYFDFGHKHISLSVKLAGAALLSMLLLLTPMAFLMFPA